MMISSDFDNRRVLKFCGDNNYPPFLDSFVQEKNPLQKFYWAELFELSAGFQNFAAHLRQLSAI